ncbi:MAG TPA: YDG domain-containing protein [Rhizomicrobium sp.]|nr:YDG domain-containing protein [Rhizomicrobium sp.]
MARIPPRPARLQQRLLLTASFTAGLCATLFAALAAADAGPLLPSGGTVAAGDASILQNSSSATVVQQQSGKAVINWQSFSVGAGASVTFQQPGSAAITLNRVTGASPSAINGSLLANGQVWLVNGNGVLFGPNSQVNVGGLLATTSDIQDGDFMAGRYQFGTPSSNPDAQVVNQGSIKAATGGSVVLSAGRVVNEGMIAAKLGHVVLGGADSFSVDFDGDNLIRYQIAAPVSQTPKDADGKPATALVSNAGTIAAQGGQVLLTARAARNVIDQVINSTGIIQANSVSLHNGEVVLDAGDGAVAVGGTVDVSGQNPQDKGGTLTVKGEQVAIADGTRLDASGSSGGGKVTIGDTTAQSVTVGQASVTADATGQGQGGTIAIVSGGAAKIAASLSAKGVSAGGHVETSGENLDISGVRVDTSAPQGVAGLWLLDPVNVAIDAPAAATIVSNLAGTNVSVTASNDITVNAPVVYTSANSLTFLAGHDLTVNANVQNSGAGAILAVAGWDGVTSAPAILNTPGAYGLNGGSVLIGGGAAAGNIALGSRNGSTIVAAGNLSLASLNGYAQLGYHIAPAVSMDASGDISVALTGSLNISAPGTPFAQIGHGGRDSLGNHSGNISVSAQGDVTLTGNAPAGYARIGNGSGFAQVNDTGAITLVSGGDVMLGADASITTTGANDALVIAAAGNFVNQSGSSALKVSGGGRWLVFLDDPANATAGHLDGTPFYNRPFDFSSRSYAAVTGTGDRFVYVLAPVLTVTANNQARSYGAANPTLTATITGALAGDAPAGVFSGSPSLFTPATASSAVGGYAISAALGSLISDYNYGFQFVSGTLQINPAALTASLTGTVRKTYDGTVLANPAAANYLLTGVLPGDHVSLGAPVSASYANKNVGAGKTVSVTGLSLQGAQAGNYVLTSLNISAAVGIIDPAILTASLTGTVRKTYDRTAAANPASGNFRLTGIVQGDSVSLSAPVSASYADKNVGSGKTVSVSGLSLLGADAGNYLLASPNISAAIGTIDPASLTASLTGTTRKTYDGTTTAALTASNYGLTGVLGGDQVSLNTPAAGSYANKNAGAGKTVTVSGLTLSGGDAGNYQLVSSSLSAAIGTIDPASVSASLTGTVQKIFDGTTDAALDASNYAVAGLLAGDDAALNNPASGIYDTKFVGTGKTVTVNGLALTGSDAGNYVLAAGTISGAVGIILVNRAPDVLGNTYTSNGSVPTGPVTPVANTAKSGPADSTAATGNLDSEDSAAVSIGQSLSGSSHSTSSVLIDGLLRQFTPAPGSMLPHGVPPYGQVYSSWGNEAFWQ